MYSVQPLKDTKKSNYYCLMQQQDLLFPLALKNYGMCIFSLVPKITAFFASPTCTTPIFTVIHLNAKSQ